MVKTKLPCPPGTIQRVTEAARKLFAARPGARFNAADGLRVDLAEGWVCVRASNTEPIMRILAEAPDRPTADNLAEEVRRIAQTVLGG
jgi:phosphomannomutase